MPKAIVTFNPAAIRTTSSKNMNLIKLFWIGLFVAVCFDSAQSLRKVLKKRKLVKVLKRVDDNNDNNDADLDQVDAAQDQDEVEAETSGGMVLPRHNGRDGRCKIINFRFSDCSSMFPIFCSLEHVYRCQICERCLPDDFR